MRTYLAKHDAGVGANALRDAAEEYPWGNGMTFPAWLRVRATTTTEVGG